MVQGAQEAGDSSREESGGLEWRRCWPAAGAECGGDCRTAAALNREETAVGRFDDAVDRGGNQKGVERKMS